MSPYNHMKIREDICHKYKHENINRCTCICIIFIIWVSLFEVNDSILLLLIHQTEMKKRNRYALGIWILDKLPDTILTKWMATVQDKRCRSKNTETNWTVQCRWIYRNAFSTINLCRSLKSCTFYNIYIYGGFAVFTA